MMHGNYSIQDSFYGLGFSKGAIKDSKGALSNLGF